MPASVFTPALGERCSIHHRQGPLGIPAGGPREAQSAGAATGAAAAAEAAGRAQPRAAKEAWAGMKSMNPLDGAFQRVARADEHIADLGKHLTEFKGEQKKAAASYFQSSAQSVKTYVSMNVGIIIGEILYNLRTALDYLVFETTKHDSGVPQDFTNFPIVDTPDKFKSWKKKAREKGIKSCNISAFQALQPYKGCKWTRALRDLSNKDKHRELSALGGTAEFKIYTRFTDADFADVPLPILRTPHPATGEEVDVKVDFQTLISFDDGMPLMETLEEIKSGVADTLTNFKPVFEG
jgi:hypothetical protein